MSTPLSVCLSTSSNGTASPYSARTTRTYVSGDKASWSAPNVVLGRLGLWDWRRRTPARRFKNWAEMFNSSHFSAMCSSASCQKEGAGYRMTRLSTMCHIIQSRRWCNKIGLLQRTPLFSEEHTHTYTVTSYIVWHANNSHPHGQKSIHKSCAPVWLCTIERITFAVLIAYSKKLTN